MLKWMEEGGLGLMLGECWYGWREDVEMNGGRRVRVNVG